MRILGDIFVGMNALSLLFPILRQGVDEVGKDDIGQCDADDNHNHIFAFLC